MSLAYSKSSNYIFNGLQIVISQILYLMWFLLWLAFSTTNAINSSVMRYSYQAMPSLTNIQDQPFLRLRWYSFSWWGNKDIHCLTENATSPLYMNYYHKVTFRLPQMQDKILLRLCWDSFSAWGKECATVVLLQMAATASFTDVCKQFTNSWPSIQSQ